MTDCHQKYFSLLQIRQLAAKVLFALSVNNFNAVFSRISGRLAELSVTNGEESTDYTDIELVQYINIDILKLIKLLNEAIAKFRYISTNKIFYSDCRSMLYRLLFQKSEEIRLSRSHDISRKGYLELDG